MKDLSVTAAYNRVDPRQIELLDHLEKNKVRYLVFGSMAVSAYEKSPALPTMKLWVQPSESNLAKLNTVLSNLGQQPVAYKQDRKTLEGEKKLRDQIGADLYGNINGFTTKQFDELYARSTRIQAIDLTNRDHRLPIHHLSFPDLYANMAQTQSSQRDSYLKSLRVAGEKLGERSPEKTETRLSDPSPQTPSQTRLRMDFEEVRKQLDIETVLERYGYQLSSKNRPNDAYRIYKPAETDSSQRLAVMVNPTLAYKGFVDINNTSFKGDVVSFIHTMEQGDWKRTFQMIDTLLHNPHQAKRREEIQRTPLKAIPAKVYLNDEKLIQSELVRTYQVETARSDASLKYLVENRGIAKTTLTDPHFSGQILTAVTQPKNNPHITFTNTAFPLTNGNGYIETMDMRNVGFKAFPEDFRKEAVLWRSNPLVALKEQSTLSPVGSQQSREFPAGTQAYYSRNGLVIDGEVYKNTTPVSFFKPTAIVITESPIDALSFHQLNPPKAHENRMYLSAAGTPSLHQLDEFKRIFINNSQARIVLALDGDNPGIRQAVNLMSQDATSRLRPSIHYATERTETGKATSYNVLRLELSEWVDKKSPSVMIGETLKSQLVEKSNALVNKINQFLKPEQRAFVTDSRISHAEHPNENKRGIVSSSVDIRLPNDHKSLVKATEHVVRLANELNGHNRLELVRPTQIQKDFNNVLKERQGKPLAESSNLHFSGQPLTKVNQSQAFKPDPEKKASGENKEVRKPIEIKIFKPTKL